MSKTKTGSNAQFISAGRGLIVINDYCYAYSGMINPKAGDPTDLTILEFATGKQMIKAMFTASAPTAPSDTTAGLIGLYRIYFNEIEVARVKTDAQGEDMPTIESFPIIIPPLTAVKVTVSNNSDSSSYQNSCHVAGRLYG
jgi:hypothetical protein